MLKHWIWLTQRKGIGHVGCKILLSAFQTAEEIYQAEIEEISKIPGFRKTWIPSLMDKNTDEAERVVAECDRLGIRIITFHDRAYPLRLKEIHDPPTVLYCKGEIPKVDEECVVAIVGTRKCSNYGIITAKQLSTLISLSGGIVVSGGARGIDTISLNCALGSVTPVICVLAGGLDSYYPAENKKLFESVIQHGCLLSEVPPGTKPIPMGFVARNRIISGLSTAVLIVEAPKSSGALTTADLAISQNRDVYTVERKDGGKFCEGNDELIASGCKVVSNGWELLSNYVDKFPGHLVDGRTDEAAQILYRKRYGKNCRIYSPIVTMGNYRPEVPNRDNERQRETVKVPPRATVPEHTADIPKDLPEGERIVLSIIGAEPIEMDMIITRSGLPSNTVSRILTMLQLKKRIIKCFGNSYQRI